MSASISYRSKLFMPRIVRGNPQKGTDNSSTNLTSRSQRLFVENGLVEPIGRGLFQILPVGFRILHKLIEIIDSELEKIGAQRIQLSALNERQLWEKSGRWNQISGEIFKITDSMKKEYCLAPTQEESITQLVSNALQQKAFGATKANYPLLLYQTTPKYRDEMHPRFGLLRSREFIMKDLYTFDICEQSATETYEKVTAAYNQIFQNAMRIDTLRVKATSGAMGGSISHEYHLPCPTGQDYIQYCYHCATGLNEDLNQNPTIQQTDLENTIEKRSPDPVLCSECHKTMTRIRTIEIAHTFMLGRKYTETFSANYLQLPNDKSSGTKQESIPLEMCCFGIGVTRAMAAIADYLSTDTELRWPNPLSPFQICIIPPKLGSKEDIGGASNWSNFVLEYFSKHLITEWSLLSSLDILFDDRTDMTIGRRLIEAKQLGIPVILICGKTVLEDVPKFELVYCSSKAGQTKTQLVDHSRLIDCILSHLSKR